MPQFTALESLHIAIALLSLAVKLTIEFDPAAATLFLDKKQIHKFEDIAYRHNPVSWPS